MTKTSGQQTTTYVYDAMGNLAAEYGYSVSAPCTTCYVAVVRIPDEAEHAFRLKQNRDSDRS